MAYLRAFGAYVPERVMDNAEMASRLGCEPDWIVNVSGISERRYAEAESVSDMAVRAAENCLSDADRAKIGMVVVCSGSAERRFPGPAVTVSKQLGLGEIPVLDLPMASAGSLFGLALANQLAGTYGDILVIGAEKMSSVVNREPLDKNTAILFGDGAGACLVSETEGPAKIVDSVIHTDGSFAEDLRLEFGESLWMNGRSVIMQASRKIPKVIRELLSANARVASDVDVFLMHQANQNLIDKVATTLEVLSAKFYSNIERYGNTSSASMLIAAAEWQKSAGFKKDASVVFAGFGAGFHWGALLAVGI